MPSWARFLGKASHYKWEKLLMNSKPGKKGFFDAFKIEDKESCAKAIKNGGIAAMISAGISALFGIAGFFTSSDDQELKYVLDPWILVDVVLIVVLGIFVFRKSRVASTLLFIYYTAGKCFQWYELGKPSGLLMAMIFVLYYFTAMRGTYLWHSKYRLAEAAPA
jgi:hypothetical protein